MGQGHSSPKTVAWFPTASEIHSTRQILVFGCGLPVEIATEVLRLAKYWAADILIYDVPITIHETEEVLIQVDDVLSELKYMSSVRLEHSSGFENGPEDSLDQKTGKIEVIDWNIISHDQGWSDYTQDHGTYRNSWTWFEVAVFKSIKPHCPDSIENSYSDNSKEIDNEAGLNWHRICCNIHARYEFTTHNRTWLPNHPFIQELKHLLAEEQVSTEKKSVGIKVRAVAHYPGWMNSIQNMECKIYYSF
ncbi:hypothetical protein O181_049037 [Austropuccinia psidii MF-1]|uniref:Uncharacterized protein n=1 Tax=Austropuccinia psidii MF-1 TaxID=1389203 RepID=A0A9Q3HM81_9BASI|nr:hypothetical protein [Austropuccinia psidii MF-1]